MWAGKVVFVPLASLLKSATMAEAGKTSSKRDVLAAHQENIQDVENSISSLKLDGLDKEKIRRIKQNEKAKLNWQKKQALKKNLSHMSAAELQLSVANIARTFGVPKDEVSSSTQEPPVSADQSALVKTEINAQLDEVTVCIVDASDVNFRLSSIDLTNINEGLEKSMYKDLNLTPKIKICNTILSSTRHVWVVCQSQFTADWVINKVKEVTSYHGRTFSGFLLSELAYMSAVSVLVPKECGFVRNFKEFLSFLILHNPSLGAGYVTEELINVSVGRNELENSIVNDKHTSANEDSCVSSSDASNHNEAVADDTEVQESSEADTSKSVQTNVVSTTSADWCLLDGPRHSRSFSFYADDIWIDELKKLKFTIFLGLRRLTCIVRDRQLARVGNASGEVDFPSTVDSSTPLVSRVNTSKKKKRQPNANSASSGGQSKSKD